MIAQLNLFSKSIDVSKDSQCGAILEYLQSGNTITPMEALNFFGCSRLSARIWNLKEAGYKIKTKIIGKNGKHFAEYYMEEYGKN